MHFGASMFCTDYSMTPAALGRELENRGFESFWAPEHSHIPLSRKSPWGGGPELPKRYYDVIDPFVGLATAAAVTKTLKLADHGTDPKTRIKLMAERVAMLKTIWTQTKPEFQGEFQSFEPMMTWPKPVQKPHPLPPWWIPFETSGLEWKRLTRY